MFDCTLVQLKYNQKLIKNTIKTKDVVLVRLISKIT